MFAQINTKLDQIRSDIYDILLDEDLNLKLIENVDELINWLDVEVIQSLDEIKNGLDNIQRLSDEAQAPAPTEDEDEDEDEDEE
jgi:hypothetical protein